MAENWESPKVNDEEPNEGPVDDAAQGVEMAWAGIQRDPDAVEEGNQLGQVIDVDDDMDNGGVPLDVPPAGEGVLAPVEGVTP